MATRVHEPISAAPFAAVRLFDHGLWIAMGAALLVRFAAFLLLDQPVVSDSLAYFTMAQSLAETGVITDQFGQHAFYSPGYPILLAPLFAMFGASTPVAHLLNLALAAATTALIWRLVRELGGDRIAGTLGALGFAVWMPAIWSSTLPARENLAMPLVTGLALVCVQIAKGNADWRRCALAGVVYGLAVLAGTSAVLTAAAFVVALAIALYRTPRAGVRRLFVFAAGGLLVLLPWLGVSDQLVGRPVITTNGPFNLYIGNNPAATGRFVSMRDTPIGRAWHDRAPVLGEAAAGDWLARETATWAKANPARTLQLAAKKLALFWAPNAPDRADFAQSRAIAALRLVDVAQWALIMVLAGITLFGRPLDRRVRWTLAALVVGFWLIHGATYIIPRYRDPVMPVLIALAGLAARRWLPRPSPGDEAI